MAFLRAHDWLTHGTPRDTRSRRAALRAGFSLVELVVVLVVATTIAAIAAPRFANSAARARIVSAADRLGAEIVLTRDRARAASSPRIMRVTPGAGIVRITDQDSTVLGTFDLSMEPYLASVARTDLPGSQIEFTAYALPAHAGRVMLRSGGYLAIVSIASDATVSRSEVARARTAHPALSDVVTELGSDVSVREIAATSANVIASVEAKK